MNRILLISLIFISVQSFSQNPNFIKWENCYGGTNWEYMYCGKKTVDGGSILGGYTNSYNGDIQSGNKGDSDSWLVKVDSLGEIMWEKTYGGSSWESIIDVLITSDGGFLLGGYTNSNDGDVQSGKKGNCDFWLVKINSVGTIEWEKTYGGSSDDFIFSIQLTPDNGYILGGETKSNNGDIQSGNKGGTDFWVIKVDNVGTIEWEKTYGGSGDDNLRTIVKTKNGYLLGGYTFSNDGDVQSGNKGEMDWWIVMVDNLGNINWERTYGGSYNDQLNSIIPSFDNNGFLLCGYESSNDGDIQSGDMGGTDSWIVNIDSLGEIIWEKTYGGSGLDEFKSILTVKDGYFIGGKTGSNDGDVQSGNKGGYYDYWVVKTDNSGNLEWEKTFGGSDEDNFVYLHPSNENFILGGYSKSNDGDIESGNNGSMDYWVLNIGSGTIPSDIMLSPNIVNENNSDSILVGVLTTLTDDKNDSFSYTVISGDGDEDNNCFYIINDSLFTNITFDYEMKSTYSVRIQTIDSEGNTFSKKLNVLISNLNDIEITDSILISPYCSDDSTGSIIIELDDYVESLSFLWSTGDTSQNISNLPYGMYSVEIIDGEGMSITKDFNLPLKPIYDGTSICYITSEGESNVIYIDKGEDNYNIDRYVIYREGIIQNEYEKIGEFSSTDDYFIDTLINNRTQSFSYKISMIDSCENESPLSSNHNTIHLSKNRGTSGEVNLYWTHYVGLNIPSYSIYRQEGNKEFELLKQISTNNNTYTDFTSNPIFNYQYYISFELENTCYTDNNTKSGEVIEVKSNTVSTDTTYTGIKNFVDNNYKVYPNPFNDKLIIETNSSKDTELRLYDLNGCLLLVRPKIQNKSEINLSGLSTGIYLIKLLNDNNEVYNQKIVKY